MKGYLPILALISANSITFVGVYYWGWNLIAIIFAFWFENVIVGVSNVFKMRASIGGNTTDGKNKIVGFVIYYFLFTFVHGSVLLNILLAFGVDYLKVLPLVVSLSISHYISYRVNYIGKAEFERESLDTLQWQPFVRVIAMQIFIIGGGLLVIYSLFDISLSPSIGVVELREILWRPTMLLVTGKIIIDLISHLHEHRYFWSKRGPLRRIIAILMTAGLVALAISGFIRYLN